MSTRPSASQKQPVAFQKLRKSAAPQRDRGSLCSFSFADGRQCRTPRLSHHPHFCYYHAQKEAQALAAEQLGRDVAPLLSRPYVSACDLASALARLFTAAAHGHVKPKTTATLAYLGQVLVQTIQLAQHEYINAFGSNAWRHIVASSFNSPDAPPATPAPAPCIAGRTPAGSSAPSSNPSPASTSSRAPSPNPVAAPPRPATPLPTSPADFASLCLASVSPDPAVPPSVGAGFSPSTVSYSSTKPTGSTSGHDYSRAATPPTPSSPPPPIQPATPPANPPSSPAPPNNAPSHPSPVHFPWEKRNNSIPDNNLL